MELFILRGDQQEGPYNLEAISEAIASGAVSADDWAWMEGCEEWVKLGELIDIAVVETPSSSNPPALPNSPPARPGSDFAGKLNGAVSRLLSDEQDPATVEKLMQRVTPLLTQGEDVAYVGVQKKPIVNISPDAVILTNKRFMIVRPGLMSMTFEDFQWREVANVHMSEQMLGATITCTLMNGKTTAIDSIPKKQARKIYAYAQEIEEQAHVARHNRDLEVRRASAGGVVIQSPIQSPLPSQGESNDPVKTLQKLKALMDSGLINEGEYNTKKAEILSRL